MIDIDLKDYDYDLPLDRIAQYPVKERDLSQLLIYEKSLISKDTFSNICNYLPADSLLVFNNTRVIRARILFQKNTGASIEVLCLEPLSPSDYDRSLSSFEPVEWKCIVGNLKKWKHGILFTPFKYNGKEFNLHAERIHPEGEAWRIRFTWECHEISFGEVIEAVGHIPLPPYINREDELKDTDRYQTIYSSIRGSVAAPTAGLHFSEKVFEEFRTKGIKSVEVTLHVGAGTFQPIKSNDIYKHEMHCEHIFVSKETIESLIENQGKIISVGTTTSRTLESLFWLGVKLTKNHLQSDSELNLGQWEIYELDSSISVNESLNALLSYLKKENLTHVCASTSIMITPGYRFMMIKGLITNFHQPKSTLLLLISSLVGSNWKKIYKYALNNNFRFLNYGDCSLILT